MDDDARVDVDLHQIMVRIRADTRHFENFSDAWVREAAETVRRLSHQMRDPDTRIIARSLPPLVLLTVGEALAHVDARLHLLTERELLLQASRPIVIKV